jgi:hypothetical protein
MTATLTLILFTLITSADILNILVSLGELIQVLYLASVVQRLQVLTHLTTTMVGCGLAQGDALMTVERELHLLLSSDNPTRGLNVDNVSARIVTAGHFVVWKKFGIST